MGTEKPKQTVQSVERALAILETVADGPNGVSANEVALALDLRLPTTYHLLTTLVQAGYLRKDGRIYLLDGKVSNLARALERNLQPDIVVQDAMHAIAARTGETAYISRWVGDEVTIVDVAEGTHAVRVAGVHVGLRGNSNARASGKVLLAFGPEERRRSYLSQPLQALTPNTLTDPDDLEAAFRTIRTLGHAIDLEEFVLGVSCLAAPCGGDLAITVTMPSGRFEEARDDVLAVLMETTRPLVTGGAIGSESA
jgi:IclR family acetate operon transcriptional repressor